ncbi:hypothetical protein D3C72_2334160 [compost metagenome]
MWTKARAVAALSPSAPLDAAEVEVAFRAPLFLPGQAGLYVGPTLHQECGGASRDFEVRDATGARAHLRGRLTLSPEDSVAC